MPCCRSDLLPSLQLRLLGCQLNMRVDSLSLTAGVPHGGGRGRGIVCGARSPIYRWVAADTALAQLGAGMLLCRRKPLVQDTQDHGRLSLAAASGIGASPPA